MKTKIVYLLLLLFPLSLIGQAENQQQKVNHFQKGMQHFNNGEFDAAIQSFTKVVNQKAGPNQKNAPAQHPKKAEAFYFIGMSYAKKSNEEVNFHEQALANFNKALEVKPEYPLAKLERGKVLIELKRYDQAVADLTAAVEAFPGKEEAHYQLALAYSWMNNYQKAIEHFKHVVEINPNNAYAHYFVGLAYSKTNENGLAEQHWRAFLKLCPTCPEAPVVNNFLSRR